MTVTLQYRICEEYSVQFYNWCHTKRRIGGPTDDVSITGLIYKLTTGGCYKFVLQSKLNFLTALDKYEYFC